MAKFNEILVGRYNRLLQKLLQIKGTAPTPVLSTEVQPVLPLFMGVENRYLESFERFGLHVFLPAGGVGFTSQFRLRNPAASNVIAIVEKILLEARSGTQALVVHYGSIGTDFATLQQAQRLDARQRLNHSLILSTTNAVALASFGTEIEVVTALINTPWDFIRDEHQELPILPGDAIQLYTDPNVDARFSVVWRERFLEESERT